MTWRRAAPWLALAPMVLVVVVVYLGGLAWTLRTSFSSSRTFPIADFVGLSQYLRLFGNERWLLSLRHGALFTLAFLAVALLVGTLLAIALDRRLRGAALFRGIFLYPYALSFVASGLVWQWMLNPGLGIEHLVRAWGLPDFRFDWIVDPERVMYAILLATIWQVAGLVAVIVLAGLRGVDESIWHAARVDGIPTWRVYCAIVLPTLGATYSTAVILLLAIAVKLYDPVVAMTQGGPGLASEVPAKFIMEHLFGRANLALASAAAITLTLSALALLAPLYWAQRQLARRSARA